MIHDAAIVNRKNTQIQLQSNCYFLPFFIDLN